MPPEISVIIPTHNRDWAIRRSVESALAQSFGNFELLVVDDGSTDQTRQVLANFSDPRLRVVETENRGVSCARNTGIQRAKGEWLAFLDSDDEWPPYKLQLQRDYLQNFPRCKVVHGEEIWIRRGVRVNPKKKHAKSGGWIFQKCLSLCLISPSAVMIHREVFRHIGYFDPRMTVCEDYDLWLRMTPFYQVGFVEKPIIKKYGGHPDQLSTRYHAMDYFRIRAIAKVLEFDLSREDRMRAMQVFQEKIEILLSGYRKRSNWDRCRELERLRSDRLTQSRNPI